MRDINNKQVGRGDIIHVDNKAYREIYNHFVILDVNPLDIVYLYDMDKRLEHDMSRFLEKNSFEIIGNLDDCIKSYAQSSLEISREDVAKPDTLNGRRKVEITEGSRIGQIGYLEGYYPCGNNGPCGLIEFDNGEVSYYSLNWFRFIAKITS